MARLVFLGTPRAAVPPLEAIVGAGHEVALVITRADKRRGRGKDLSPSPVKVAAESLGLPISHHANDAAEVGAELGVVVAYGALIKPIVLDRLPMVNLHFSLLPRWRGAAPVERAILSGDSHTGVCLMAVEEGLDTGGVFGCRTLSIDPNESAEELRARLVGIGTEMLVKALADGADGLGVPVAQGDEATYAAKITVAELQLDFSRPAVELHRVVRVGRAWTTWKGSRLGVLRARLAPGIGHEVGQVGAAPGIGYPPGQLRTAPGALVGPVVVTGDGGLEFVEVQPEGKRAMSMQAWLNGARPGPTDRLGS
ncbi:MAG: methionyl-tRNA formyltransferase [Acidimicrobiales bacterium]